MKQIRYTIWLALTALLLVACSGTMPEEPQKTEAPTTDFYHIHISFKDTDGYDLLKQFSNYRSDPTSDKYRGEVDPELCTLRMVPYSIATPEASFFTLAKFDELHSWITPDKNGMYKDYGTWYLTSNYSIPPKKDGTPYSPLRYWICCERLFGTIVVQELVTWWEEGTVDEESGERYPECVKATLSGVELKPVKGMTYNQKGELYYVGYFLDVVLSYNGRYGNIVKP